MKECSECFGYHYTLIGCCSGRECGCFGQPVDSTPCGKCNPDGRMEPSEDAKNDYPWFFMNEDEYSAYTEQHGN